MRRLNRAALLVGACLLLFPVMASAQDPAPAVAAAGPIEEPIGPFVLDARLTMARFKGVPIVAGSLGVAASDLPTRGVGLVVGGHFYPVRRRSFALGIGGELLLRARGGRTIAPAIEDGPDGPTVVTNLTAISPQVSLNFGRRKGYSYVSGGIGLATLTTELEDTPVTDAETRPRAFNYGGGARWFTRKHLAFTLDLRFYKVGAQEVTGARPAYPAATMMVFSAGISTR